MLTGRAGAEEVWTTPLLEGVSLYIDIFLIFVVTESNHSRFQIKYKYTAIPFRNVFINAQQISCKCYVWLLPLLFSAVGRVCCRCALLSFLKDTCVGAADVAAKRTVSSAFFSIPVHLFDYKLPNVDTSTPHMLPPNLPC